MSKEEKEEKEEKEREEGLAKQLVVIEEKLERKLNVKVYDRGDLGVTKKEWILKHFGDQITTEQLTKNWSKSWTFKINHEKNFMRPMCCGRYNIRMSEINISMADWMCLGITIFNYMGGIFPICPKCLQRSFCENRMCEIGSLVDNYIRMKYSHKPNNYQIEILCTPCYNIDNPKTIDIVVELKRRNDVLMMLLSLAQLNYRFPDSLVKIITEYADFENMREYLEYKKSGIKFII